MVGTVIAKVSGASGGATLAVEGGTSSTTYELSKTDGAAGEFLKTDGSGALSFATGGKVLQQAVIGTSSVAVTQTAAAFIDTGLSVTITPTAATSKILILVNHGVIYRTGATSLHMQLLRDSSTIQDWANGYLLFGNPASIGTSGTFTYLDAPSSTSALVYKTQLKNESVGSGIECTVMAGPTDGSIIALEIGV